MRIRLLLLLTLLFCARVQAATFTVTSTADPGDGVCDVADTGDGCTLREAVSAAYRSADEDVVTFDTMLFSTPQIITLAGSELIYGLGGKLTINGPGANLLSISANRKSCVFTLFDSPVILRGMTITGGAVQSGHATNVGGGIYNWGTLTVENCTFTKNSASAGGALYNHGALTVENCTFTENFSIGAANISSDTAPYNNDSGVTPATFTKIRNCTISGNTSGGGVYNSKGLTLLESCTITSNLSAFGGRGGGVLSEGDKTQVATLVHNCIIVGNRQSNNFNNNVNDDVAVDDPINDNNNTFYSLGYNLIGAGNTIGAFSSIGDQTGVTVQQVNLGPLQYNGGSTQTCALQNGSLAIEAGDPAYNGSLTTDQRGLGFPRLCGFVVDIGAYELQVNPAIVSIAPGFSDTFSEAAGNNATQLRIIRSGDLAGPLRVNLRTSDISEATVQPTADFLTGQNTIDVPINAVDDTLRDGTQNVLVEVTAPGLVFQKVTVHVTDNDPAALSARLAPAAFAENKTGTAAILTIEHNRFNISRAVTVSLSSNDTRLHLPATVDIPIGKRSVEVPVTVTPDAAIQGTITTTVTATATAFNKATVTATIYDAEAALTLSVKPGSPATISEGPSNTSTMLRVSRNTPTTSDIVVTLSLRRGDGQITLPATVTIPAGQTFADFTVNAVDDAIVEDTQSVAIRASVRGYKSASTQLFVLDNDEPASLLAVPNQPSQ